LIRRGVSNKNAHVVFEGIDPPIVDETSVRRLRQEHNLDVDRSFVVGYIGRRDFDKGYLHVLHAAALLASQLPDLKLLISGYGKTGSELPEYQSLVKSNAIVDLGVADEETKLAAIGCSDIIALPSRAETYPIVFVEAWFMEKPVIGARIGSVASVVREGIDGYLIEFGDTKALANVILRFYKDRDLAKSMGMQARDRAEKEFLFTEKIKQIKEIYQKTVSR
jgi:glycosyltransferase involved in cell wall biosynthesis